MEKKNDAKKNKCSSYTKQRRGRRRRSLNARAIREKFEIYIRCNGCNKMFREHFASKRSTRNISQSWWWEKLRATNIPTLWLEIVTSVDVYAKAKYESKNKECAPGKKNVRARERGRERTKGWASENRGNLFDKISLIVCDSINFSHLDESRTLPLSDRNPNCSCRFWLAHFQAIFQFDRFTFAIQSSECGNIASGKVFDIHRKFVFELRCPRKKSGNELKWFARSFR